MRNDLNRKTLKLLNQEEIPTPDYNQIYLKISRKIRKKNNYWPIFVFLAALLIVIFIPKNHSVSYQMAKSTALESAYYEEELVAIEDSYIGYEDPYALLLQLDQEDLKIVVNELKEEVR